MKRVFIGVFPSKETQDALTKLSSNLQQAEHFTPCKANWIPSDKFHLTYVFIGDVEDSIIPDLERTIGEIAGEYKEVEFPIQKLGYFPNPKNPKVLWVGLKDQSEQLREISKKLCQKCDELGLTLPDHRFLPHVTLARFKGLKGTRIFQNAIRSYDNKVFGSWSVDRIELIESHLSQDGPAYRSIFSSNHIQHPSDNSSPNESEAT